MFLQYLLQGRIEALEVRGNVRGVEVVLVCNCGEVVLDDPVCVCVVHSNNEGQLWLHFLLLKRWIGARKLALNRIISNVCRGIRLV